MSEIKNNEDKPFTLEDVPIAILLSIKRKWEDALKKGWHKDLWKECSLCRWIRQKKGQVFICMFCPLPPTDFCAGYPGISKLHIGCHDTEEEWKEAVKEFVSMIETELKRRHEE
ncbi:hypothetical protein B6U67_03740 [Methanosarcinales archaeon ex4484_138]|nr:MAG: hypothetical protein B6U67_03740 [Methanosarcinales archaeon ex4484_138]